jgi:hypothetical protein
MADAIVQTIKVEVDGADQAADEIKKVGEATEDVQKTAAKTAGGTQEFGKGLDDVSGKSRVSQRELRALGRVMKDLGGGELAGTAVSFARMAMILVGASLFALGAAFTFVKDKMKEAEEQTKALIGAFGDIAKKSAEMKAENDAAFWGTTADAMKKTANEADRVADKFRNLRAGNKEPIDPLTTEKGLQEGFIRDMERSGIAVNDVTADVDKLGKESQKAALLAAEIYQNLSPIQKLNFEKAVLKDLLKFPDENIKSIEKGVESLRKAQAEAARIKLSPEAAAKVKEMQDAFSSLGDTAGRIGNDILILFGLKLKTIFIDLPTAIGNAFSGIALPAGFGDALVQAVKTSIEQVKQLITAGVTTPVANAWQWIVDMFNTAVGALAGTASAAYYSIVEFVTTAPGSAWQWIVEYRSIPRGTWPSGMPEPDGVEVVPRGGADHPSGSRARRHGRWRPLGGRGKRHQRPVLSGLLRRIHRPRACRQQPGVLALLEVRWFRAFRLTCIGRLIPAYARRGVAAARGVCGCGSHR